MNRIEDLRTRMYQYGMKNRQNPNVCLYPVKEWNDFRAELHKNLDLYPLMGRSAHGEYDFCGMIIVPCDIPEIRLGVLEAKP